MDPTARNAIAALLIIAGFGIVAYFMPSLMLAVGQVSPFAAALLAVLFVAAFFGIFWLRARWQKRNDR